MRYKIKKLGCSFLIIVLLPYIVTIFLNGPTVMSRAETAQFKVNVKKQEENVEIPLEEYAVGILAREISPLCEMETIKAQAIMVRTKIYKNIQEKGSDMVFTEKFWEQQEMEEAWGISQYSGYYKKLESAWKDTDGQVLIYKGDLISTPFFSLSNGSTRDGREVLGKNYTYLKIKDCPLDLEAVEQLQTVTIEKEDIEIISLDTAGYVLKVRVGNDEVSGEEFRKNYNLASGCFSVQEYEGKIRITTRGVGHGVGLSQNTANKMAEEGKQAEEILLYFYDGCEIMEVVDMVTSEKIEKL